jgi:ATP-dependent DNA helicase RecQ
VDFRGGDRPVAVLTDAGTAAMRGDRPARLLLPPARGPRDSRLSPAPRGAGTIPQAGVLDAGARVLFEALRSHRLEIARRESVPPYVVASDRSLRDIAEMRPSSLSELQLAHGIGPAKAEKYGAGILAVVAQSVA